MSKSMTWKMREELIRDGAVDLQSELHKRRYTTPFEDTKSAHSWISSGRTKWRHSLLVGRSHLVTGKPIGGKVLEIGAGTAWLSAVLSRKNTVDRVYALEYDPYCVNTLMPKVFKSLLAEEKKITRVLGSFNDIPGRYNNYFNFVMSVGALHHSEDLEATMKAMYATMAPDSWLLACEPCANNDKTNAWQEAQGKRKDQDSQKKYGKSTNHEDNSDHWYRVCEYEVAAYKAGFEVHPFTYEVDGNIKDDRTLKTKETYKGLKKVVLYPHFADKGEFDRLFLVLRKPQ